MGMKFSELESGQLKSDIAQAHGATYTNLTPGEKMELDAMTTKQLGDTEQINRTRLDLFSGPEATRLVATIAERLRSQSRKRRIVAIGRSVNGGAFQVTAPVASPMRPPADWPTPDEIDAIIGTRCYGYA